MEEVTKCGNIRYEQSHVANRIIHRRSRSVEVIGGNKPHRRKHKSRSKNINEWNNENMETITKWQNDLEITSFIYNDNLEQYQRYTKRILVITLIGTLGTMLLSGLNIALGPSSHQWIVLGFNVGTLFISIMVFGVNGLIPIYSWDERIKQFGPYSERLSALWVIIESEINMIASHRINASDFIKRIYGQYINLKSSAPTIESSDATKSERKYKNNILDDHIWNQKFNKKIREVEEV